MSAVILLIIACSLFAFCSLITLKMFLFSFGIWQFDYYMSGNGFLCVYLWLIQLFGSVSWHFLSNLEHFNHCFFRSFFSAVIFLSTSPGSPITHISDSLIFFNYGSFLFSFWSFSSSFFLLVCVQPTDHSPFFVSPPGGFLHFLYYMLFISTIFTWFFFIVCVSLVRAPIWSLLTSCFSLKSLTIFIKFCSFWCLCDFLVCIQWLFFPHDDDSHSSDFSHLVQFLLYALHCKCYVFESLAIAVFFLMSSGGFTLFINLLEDQLDPVEIWF